MPDVGVINSCKRKEYEVFYWTISNLSEKNDFCYTSPGFIFNEKAFELIFYPNDRSSNSEFFGLFLYCDDSGSGVFRIMPESPYYAHLTLGFKNRCGRIEKGFSQNIIILPSAEYGAPALIRKSEFLKRREEVAPSDCLTFVAILGPEALEIIQDFADQDETEKENNDEENSKKKGGERVLGDMAKLLASGDRSDATVVVGEAVFRVHSCILAARTPVFAALFEHDTLEKATRKITIPDCEPEVFAEFLNYIYSGSVQNLTTGNAFAIYRVADKYLVEDLKGECRKHIVYVLSPETFCETVQLGLRCGDEALLQSAFDFCSKNMKLIIRSVEWQQYIKENPIEANEILIKSLGPV